MRVPSGALAFLLLIPLSGCLGGDPAPHDADDEPLASLDATGHPVPVPLCHDLAKHPAKATAYQEALGRRCDFEMTPDDGRTGNEATLAVNPLDPRNVVGGAKDYAQPDAGECVWVGAYVSHDGGRTEYADRSVEGSPRRLLADPAAFEPNYASQFWCTTDPVVRFGPDGTLYYLLMAYQADPVTGSRACEGVCPPGPTGPGGALNDWAINRAAQVVAVSTDGGDTFDRFTPAVDGSFPVNLADRGWLAVGNDGTVHAAWISYFVPGNLYCRSTDGAETFLCTEILAVQFLESGQGTYLATGPDREVHASWYAGGGARLRTSLDAGETWGPVVEGPRVNAQEMPGLSPRDHRGGYPALAADANPDSPLAGTVYLAWSDACGDPEWKPVDQCARTGANSVYVSASHDHGRTFGTPVRVSAAPGNGSVTGWSLFPAVSVSPGGVVDVSWMDTLGAREADGHPTFQQHYAYSLDGGATWSEPFSVRDADDDGWDPALSLHQNGMVFVGDYNDIDSSWQAAHPVWPDTRDGHADVYTATLQRPMFADGWDPEKRVEAVAFIEAHPL